MVADRRRHRILIVGDLMIDRYVIGTADRIAPEAPVPVLRVASQYECLGGAGNVARFLRNLDCAVDVVAVVGPDAAGVRARELLADIGVSRAGLIVDEFRTTTIKERHIGRGQQMLRVDRETTRRIVGAVENAVLASAVQGATKADAVILSDYGKGVLSDAVLTALVDATQASGVPVLVDPKRTDYAAYRGAALLTPNRAEASAASGIAVVDAQTATEAARVLAHRYDLDAVAITLDCDGILLVRRDDPVPVHAPVAGQEVVDVTGAGDMVVSVLALALAGGHDMRAACGLANLAAASSVSRFGTAPVSRAELARLLDLARCERKLGPRFAAVQPDAVLQPTPSRPTQCRETEVAAAAAGPADAAASCAGTARRGFAARTPTFAGPGARAGEST